MMIEFLVYSSIYMILLLAMLRFVIPRSIKEHLMLVKRAKSGEVKTDKPIESGVATDFVNIVDILSLILMFCITGFSLSLFAQKPAEVTPEEVSTVSMSLEGLMKNLLFQVLGAGTILGIIGGRTNLVKQFGLSGLDIKRMLKYVALTLGCAWAFTGIVIQAGYFEYLNELLGTKPLQSAVIFLQESTDYTLIALLAVCACVGAPLVEELVFRGYLYPIIKRYTGVPFSIIFSALFFSLIHFNLAAMPTLFLMGGLLAYSYEKTKTLWTPVLAHFIFNSLTVCLQILSRFIDITLPS